MEPMSSAPADRPFLVRTIGGYTHFARLREGYKAGKISDKSSYRWDVIGLPVFVDDSHLSGWTDLPEGFNTPDFIGF